MKNKRKLTILTFALITSVLVGCNESEDPIEPLAPDYITSIKLDKRCASMFYSDKEGSSYNEEIQLSPTVLPRKSGPRSVVWSSSNPTVATVDDNGLVKAVGEGFAEITVANADGSISASTHICVNNQNGNAISYCNTRQSDIFKTQDRSTFVIPDVVTAYETFENVLTKNDVVMKKTYFTQAIKTSKKNAFVQLDIDQIEWKCEGGSPVFSSFQYVFYTTEQYESYLFKTEGLSKNYMSVNQSEFIGKGQLTALKAICNNFFKSGDSIITSNYSDVLMQSTQGWIESKDFNEHFGRMADVPGQLAFDVRDSYTYTATAEDEDDMNIPTGTKYTLDIYDRFLYENFFCKSKYIEQTISYDLGEDHYVDDYVVDYFYQTGEEIVYPEKENYSLVDSIFNL